MENLTGAADNEDTFVFEGGGSLTGLIEGGDRGFDTLEVHAAFEDATFTYTGPTSGSIGLDGTIWSYAGTAADST